MSHTQGPWTHNEQSQTNKVSWGLGLLWVNAGILLVIYGLKHKPSLQKAIQKDFIYAYFP